MTGHTKLVACALNVFVNVNAYEGDAAGNFDSAEEKTSTPLEDTASFAGGEGMEAETDFEAQAK